MNKPLPPIPRQDSCDLAESLDALSLADEGTVLVHLPSCIENLDGLSLGDKQSGDLPPCVENLKGLSIVADKEPTQRTIPFPELERRRNLVENRNARSVAGKKPEKKHPDFLISHQTTFKFDFDSGLAVNSNTKDDGRRLPLQVALRQPTITQNAKLAAPSEATVGPSVQIETRRIPMPVPEAWPGDTPTKLALASAPPTVIVPPRQRLDSIPSAEARPAKNVTLDEQPTVNQDTPTKSSLGSPTSPRSLVQCSAITLAGRQCRIKFRPPATHFHLEPTPVLCCHLHKRLATPTAQTAVYTRNDTDLDRFFSDYIPKYLQKHTQEALKEEMRRQVSRFDGPGYIYVFEIRDPKRPDVIQLKVGRTVKLNKRLDEWSKQCSSQEQIPRGWWPGTIEGNNGTNVSLLRGNLKAGDPGPFCHRLERLVHLELSDVSLYEPYYRHPDWPNGASKLPSGVVTRMATIHEPCPDCKRIHKEIFTFRRPEGGYYNRREWNLIVKPVIQRWGRFVKEYYALPANESTT